MMFFHSTSLEPPVHRQCIASESRARVLGPCADGCFQNCVRADHHGNAHFSTPPKAANTNSGATLERVCELGRTASNRIPRPVRPKTLSMAIRKDHFETA